MAKGCLNVKFDQKKLEEVLPKDEVDNIAHAIIKLNEWAIPHWEWVNTAYIGSVQVNVSTVGFILDHLRKLFPENTHDVIMAWTNYGWQVNDDLRDWELRLNFNKVDYK